jgi:HK97 family phage prohead protease
MPLLQVNNSLGGRGGSRMGDVPKQHLVVTDPDKRIIAGFASVEVKDLQNDIVPASVLERAMYDYMSRGGIVIYGHSNIPVGRVVRWEIRRHPETGKPGLWIEVELFRGVIPADQVWETIKAGKVLGFSIGGVGREERVRIKTDDGREEEADLITFLQLLEISVVEEPANPHARIEYVNYMAKGNDDFSRCLSEVGGDRVDFCKWISAVYRDYGFSDVVEAIREVTGMLEGRVNSAVPESVGTGEAVKAEGPVTTDTPGAYNPTYGGTPSAQVNLEQSIAELTANPSDDTKGSKRRGGRRKRGEGEAIREQVEEPPAELAPKPAGEPSEEERQILELVSRLVGELRELLNTIRRVAVNEED